MMNMDLLHLHCIESKLYYPVQNQLDIRSVEALLYITVDFEKSLSFAG